jgi:small subunit ribosomal protein S3
MKKAVQSALGWEPRVKVACAGGWRAPDRPPSGTARTVPLHTLRADIDFGLATAKTTYGIIGVKAWVCHGECCPKRWGGEQAPERLRELRVPSDRPRRPRGPGAPGPRR